MADALPIPGDWIVQGGAVGLLGIVVVMILLGQLVPSRTYRALERDRDQWRAVALTALGQTEALIPAARVATAVTQALADSTGVRPITDRDELR